MCMSVFVCVTYVFNAVFHEPVEHFDGEQQPEKTHKYKVEVVSEDCQSQKNLSECVPCAAVQALHGVRRQLNVKSGLYPIIASLQSAKEDPHQSSHATHDKSQHEGVYRLSK